MMLSPEKRKSNSGLLYHTYANTKTKHAFDLVGTIAVDRPLCSQEEARTSALALNNVMAFVEFAVSTHEDQQVEYEDIFAGLEEIIRACRLVSLRVEQYLDLQEEESYGM